MNWTKVGLKVLEQMGIRVKVVTCLNWTKVGLKDCIPTRLPPEGVRLNWTKVGLKGTTGEWYNTSVFEFELD